MKRLILSIVIPFVLLCSARAADEKIEISHRPYLQNITDTGVTVTWVTNRPSIGWVELAPDDSTHFYAVPRPKYFDVQNGAKTISELHSVRIEGLIAGTHYRYRVVAREVESHEGAKVMYGNYAATDVYNKEPLMFKTSDSRSPTVSFAVLNDIHGKNDVLESLIGNCDIAKTDMVVFNGDMVSVVDSEERLFGGFMDKATELFASTVPIYYARGNHETRGQAASIFKRYYSQFEQHLYYTFRYGPVFFVVLDTGEDKPDTDIEYYDLAAYDDYRTEQAEWLQGVLSGEEFRSAPYKVIIAHIPPIGNWHANAEVEHKFMPLLRQAKPDVMLCGHLHRYVRCDADAATTFPIMVNSNKSIVKASVDKEGLKLEVIGTDGKRIDLVKIKPIRSN